MGEITLTNEQSICERLAHKEAELIKLNRCMACEWRQRFRKKDGSPICDEQRQKEFDTEQKGRCYAWWGDYAQRTGNKMCKQE